MREEYLKREIYERLVHLFDASSTGIWEMTPEGDVNFFNENFYKNYDIATPSSTLDDWIAILHPDDRGFLKDALENHSNHQTETYKSEYRVINRKGEVTWIEALGIATFNEEGNLTFMIGSHTDVTLKKAYDEKLFTLAYVDELTGLLNEKKLLDDLENTHSSVSSDALMIINFHQLTSAFSIYGQEKTESLIHAIVSAIKDSFQIAIRLYRISSKKVALYFPFNLEKSEVDELLSDFKIRLQKVTDVYFDSKKRQIDFSTIVINFPTEEDNLSYLDLINRIHLLLDNAHMDDPNNLIFYSSEKREALLRTIHIENRLKVALADQEFHLVYQPIVHCYTHSLRSFEALIRWNSPSYGPIFPDEFIPIAEANKDIVALGHFVIRHACRFITSYNKAHDAQIPVSLNASVIELQQLDYADVFLKILHEEGTDPKHVVVEVTESIMIDQESYVIAHLKRLQEAGIHIALDDFGSGYASLNSLIMAPTETVKIDRSVVHKMLDTPLLWSLISSIVKQCHKHHMSIIAEGIETKEMMEKIQDMGVDCLQGYYFSKPLEEAKAMEFELECPLE